MVPGLGDDGQIWGGEFFKYENYDFTPLLLTFDYFDAILGDKMPKEPRICRIISLLGCSWDAEPIPRRISLAKQSGSIYHQTLSKNAESLYKPQV